MCSFSNPAWVYLQESLFRCFIGFKYTYLRVIQDFDHFRNREATCVNFHFNRDITLTYYIKNDFSFLSLFHFNIINRFHTFFKKKKKKKNEKVSENMALLSVLRYMTQLLSRDLHT